MAFRKHWFATGFAALLVAAAGSSPAQDLERGAEVFELCVQCHGEAGEGNRLALAPAIAGLSQWYVEAQLEKFHSGARGANPEDLAGLRMYPMSLALKTEEERKALAAYVSGLPPAYPSPQLEGGDAARGKALYTPCAACHGPDASGMEVLGGPNLKVTSDWYLLTQLHNFKAGVRGRNPNDTSGGRMWPMALTLADEQAMKDVIAYIMTLAQQPAAN